MSEKTFFEEGADTCRRRQIIRASFGVARGGVKRGPEKSPRLQTMISKLVFGAAGCLCMIACLIV
ncbi:MAG TPA: hypothetical protein VGO84_11435, partial [Burkholderiales bacterium]|nr:hypothetical protein [Burkholderiales bacterium]